MNRRNFLKSMIAVASAPAIVKAENIMKVWVPPEKTILTLADWARRIDHGKHVANIVEILTETNEILDDMVFKDGDKVTIHTGLPRVYWRYVHDSKVKS